jgi:hypothetical protein
MPIVISEFEIVPEPSPSSDRAPADRSVAPPANLPPTPYEVALAIGHEYRRHARVKAD